MNKKILIGIVLVVIGLAIGSSFLGGSKESLGATIRGGNTQTNPVWFYGGASVGVSGQLISNILFGTCDFSIGATTQAISTSTVGSRSCAVTGVKAGDTVLVQPSNTNTTNWSIVGSLASSTNGYIEIKFINYSSTTTVPTTFTTGVKYIIVR